MLPLTDATGAVNTRTIADRCTSSKTAGSSAWIQRLLERRLGRQPLDFEV